MEHSPGARTRVVLLSGPIASGKTTVARQLAAHSRERGHAAAAIDMDDLVEMVGGADWMRITLEHRFMASKLAGCLARELVASNVRLVVVAQSTLSPYEGRGIVSDLDDAATVHRVLLRVSLTESVRRAQGDPGRVLTRDAGLVAKLYATLDWDAVQRDFDVDTDGMDVDEVVSAIQARLPTSH